MKVRYRNTAFLIELSINILVFSISCAILVSIFGKAWQLNRQTQNETAAATETLRLVEIIKLRGPAGVEDGSINTIGDGIEQILCYYSANWQALPSETNDAQYNISATVSPQATPTGTLTKINIVAQTMQGEELYTIETASFAPQSTGDNNG